MGRCYYFDRAKFAEDVQLDGEWEIGAESIDWNRTMSMMGLSIRQDALDREEHLEF